MSIAIHIPVYNQPELLRHCLRSIENQTRRPDSVLILDDCSSVDYNGVIGEFHNLNITLSSNPENIGSMENMLKALYTPCNADLVNVFHEDDIMHPEFLERSIRILEQEPEAAFSYSEIAFHKDPATPCFTNNQQADSIHDPDELVLMFLNGMALGFGTVVYRRSMLPSRTFDLVRFDVMCDRPFLLDICGRNKIAVLNDRLVSVNSHLGSDNRWHTLRSFHILNLYDFYRKRLRDLRSPRERKTIRAGLTQGILNGYSLLTGTNRVNRVIFLASAYLRGLLSVKYAFLTNKRIRDTASLLKNLVQR